MCFEVCGTVCSVCCEVRRDANNRVHEAVCNMCCVVRGVVYMVCYVVRGAVGTACCEVRGAVSNVYCEVRVVVCSVCCEMQKIVNSVCCEVRGAAQRWFLFYGRHVPSLARQAMRWSRSHHSLPPSVIPSLLSYCEAGISGQLQHTSMAVFWRMLSVCQNDVAVCGLSELWWKRGGPSVH